MIRLKDPDPQQTWTLTRFLTVILLVQTREYQTQFLFVVSEIMNKLPKVQLSVQVFVARLHYFL